MGRYIETGAALALMKSISGAVDVNAAQTARTGAESAASDAEAYAAGTRDGTDVGSTDPAYHNNAAYYAAQAASSAASLVIDSALSSSSMNPVQNKVINAELSDLKSHFNLNVEEIPDTVQSITFDAAGNVDTITHTRDNVAIRTDAFTFGSNTITEVRTLNTGESLTIVTNTTTLETTVTYAAA